jgi:hypothetical protein
VNAAKRRLSEAAWIALAVHALAGAAMLLVLRRGLATNPDLADRMAFVAARPSSWLAAWGSWNAAALTILYFFFRFAGTHSGRDAVAARRLRLAVSIGALAVVLDLTAEAIMMFGLPAAAREGVEAFLRTDRDAVLLTGFGANTLYTLAAVIFAWGTRRSYPRWTWTAGLGVGLAGMSLSLSVLAGSVGGMFWANVFLVPLLTAWLLGVALTSGKS